MDNLEARLQNTEKALYALVSVIIDMQLPHVQDSIHQIMADCFDANESLGSKTGNGTEFVSIYTLEANDG